MDAFERARMSLQKNGMSTVKKPNPILSEEAEEEKPIGKPIMEQTDSSKVDRAMQQNKNDLDIELEMTMRRAQFLEENEKTEQMLKELDERFAKKENEVYE